MSRQFPPALLVFSISLFITAASGSARAAGGTCPSPANMDGGVYAAPTSCYYVDFASGADTNSGTTEAAPWKHAPGMNGCSNNCSSTTLAAGNGVIFKGGVTWDYTNFRWNIPASGSVGGNDSYGGCTGASCIYFGVDTSWFTGGSWSRPIMSGGDWSNPGTNTTCFLDMDSISGTPFMVSANNHNDIIFDNFEFTGLCLQEANVPPGGNNPGYVNASGSASNITYENLYAHRVAWNTGSPSVGAAGFVAFTGSGYHLTYSVVDYTDAGPTTSFTRSGQGYYSGDGISGTAHVDHSVFYNMGDASDIAPVSVHDNYFFNAAANVYGTGFHEHISNDGARPSASTITWYNNVIDTVVAGQGMGFDGSTNGKWYIFNNLVSNSSVGGNLWFLGGTVTTSNYYLFNNTMECGADSGTPNGACSRDNGANLFVFNNHYITTAGATVHECGNNLNCSTWNTSAGSIASANFSSIPGWPIAHFVNQSKSTANGQGYTYGQTYQFSPTSDGNSTVGAGVNETAYCTAIASSGAATASADAASCQMDTTYAVTYNQTNHTAVNSGRVAKARPSSGAWDVGAYQFSSASTGQPNPPTGLAAVVQ